MKKVLIGVAVLSFMAGNASAASKLSDLRLDTVTAGAPFGFDCPGCTLASSNSASNNGITMSTSSAVIVPNPGSPGSGSTGSGSTGSGSTGAPSPDVVASIPIPANLATIIASATTTTISH